MNKLKRFSLPYLILLIVFIAIPMITMIALSFMTTEGLHFSNAVFTFANFSRLTEISVVVGLWNSLKYATIATLACLALGYPLAYLFSRSKNKNGFLITLLLVLPMWSNILLRTNALGYFFSANNMITGLLAKIGINWSIDIKGTGLSVVIGLIMVYLPFMILPIYTVLDKIDKNLYDASSDLGADPIRTFGKVTIPLSLKGVTTGIILVFLPCFSGFAVPRILGNEKIVMLGTIIEDNFIYMDYNFGSLISMLLIFAIVIALFVISKVDKEGETLL
jgi:spermidine/putrescine transport system permease protein